MTAGEENCWKLQIAQCNDLCVGSKRSAALPIFQRSIVSFRSSNRRIAMFIAASREEPDWFEAKWACRNCARRCEHPEIWERYIFQNHFLPEKSLDLKTATQRKKGAQMHSIYDLRSTFGHLMKCDWIKCLRLFLYFCSRTVVLRKFNLKKDWNSTKKSDSSRKVFWKRHITTTMNTAILLWCEFSATNGNNGQILF